MRYAPLLILSAFLAAPVVSGAQASPDSIPQTNKIDAGEFPNHQLFKYRVLLQPGVALESLLGVLQSRLAGMLADHDMQCSLEIEK